MKVVDRSYRSLGILFLGVVIGAIAGAWIVTAYLGFIRGVFQSISDLTAFISAGATVVLVIVTTAYVILTGRLVSETRDARQQEVMPVMNLELESYMMGALSPMIRNIGNGPAVDVEATVRLEPDGEEYEIGSKNIAPGEFAMSPYPAVGGDSHEDYNKLSVHGFYTDVFGQRLPFEDEINLENLSKLNEVEPSTHEEQQLKYLRKIEESLGTIAEEIEGFETLIALKKRGKIIDLIKEHGSLTVLELSEETGLEPPLIGTILAYMKASGTVDYETGTENDLPDIDVEVKLNSSK